MLQRYEFYSFLVKQGGAGKVLELAISMVISFLLVFAARIAIITPYFLYKREAEAKESLLARLNAIDGIPSEAVFDMTARDAAEYVMEQLKTDLQQATSFVQQMATEEKIHVRAMKKNSLVDSPVPRSVFDEQELHLIGNDNERQQAYHFGSSFHDDGWISKRVARRIDEFLSYTAPRFQRREVEEAVKWYSQCRPPEDTL